MLHLLDIYIQYGDRILLNNISFSAKPNEKIGLAGRNGAGKSTILKLIAGDITPDSGKISFPNGYSIGYLHQDIKIKEDKTVLEEALTAFDQLNAIEARLEEIDKELQTRTDYESDAYMRVLEELATLNDHLTHMGDMSQAQAKTERILKGLGFKHSEMNKPVAQLSGGWKMRIELAKILLSEVDLLLLDEPTNHLDIESIVWFEDYLKSYSGTLILISHDVRLLDNVTTRTIEVELGKIYDYKANYSQYLLQREERRTLLQAQYENQQKTIKEKERVIERFRAKANKAKMAQSMMKQLDRMDKIELDDAHVKSMRIKFPDPMRSGDDVLKIKDLSKSYQDLLVFQGANLSVKRGEKLAFVGQNGQGKTTLAKIIVNELENSGGTLKIGHNVQIGYFAQDQDKRLTGENTLLQTMENASPPEMRTKLRSILGAFLFSGEDVDKKVMVLSGGERMRLALAVLLLKPMNLLVMDEPTNHLDMTSKNILKQALLDYPGTLILVSHDRDFLDGLTDRTIEFRDGRLKEYLGDINYFLEKRAVDDFRSIEQRAKVTKKKKEEKKLSPNQKHEIKKEIQRQESKIEKLELKISDIEIKMADPGFYDCADSAKTIEKHSQLKQQLQEAMNAWEEAASKL
ncbi:MAG TPA: ABC transporter ATP-binding protein [Saprospiraceae bacterium]|nr:ABC transporter ATP-binding protein [Saprospiraceae bacterium]